MKANRPKWADQKSCYSYVKSFKFTFNAYDRASTCGLSVNPARLADSVGELDTDWFTEALRSGGVLDIDTKVAVADVRLFGTGQLSVVARADLEYDRAECQAPASVIIKLPSADAGSRQLGVAMGAYEAEVRFYSELPPQLNVDVPQLFWGDVDPEGGRFTLVLEDLSSWKVGDVVQGATPEQAMAAVEQIAGMQAPLRDAPALREAGWLAPHARVQALFDLVEPATPAFCERFGPRLSAAHLALVEQLAPKASQYPALVWTGPSVVMHGDFRLDNLLFSAVSGRQCAKVIDWQSVCWGPPLVDLCTCLTSCLSPDERRAGQYELLRAYHDGLCEAGVRDFSWAQCWEGYWVSPENVEVSVMRPPVGWP